MSRNNITNEINIVRKPYQAKTLLYLFIENESQKCWPHQHFIGIFSITRNFMCYKENYKKHEEMSAFSQYHRKFLEIWSFIRWQWFFGLCFVRVSSIYRGQSRKRWCRERRQKATYNGLAHAPQFLVHFFFCRHCTITTYFFSPSEISSRRIWLHSFRQIDSLNNGHKTEVEKNAKTLLKFWTCSLHGSFLRKRNILITSKE